MHEENRQLNAALQENSAAKTLQVREGVCVCERERAIEKEIDCVYGSVHVCAFFFHVCAFVRCVRVCVCVGACTRDN